VELLGWPARRRAACRYALPAAQPLLRCLPAAHDVAAAPAGASGGAPCGTAPWPARRGGRQPADASAPLGRVYTRSAGHAAGCALPGMPHRQPRRAACRPRRRTNMLTLPGATARQPPCDALCMHGTGSRAPARREGARAPAAAQPPKAVCPPGRIEWPGWPGGPPQPRTLRRSSFRRAQPMWTGSASWWRARWTWWWPDQSCRARKPGRAPAPQRRTVSCVPSLARLVCIACMRTSPMPPRGRAVLNRLGGLD
jgi:hypothetical protein